MNDVLRLMSAHRSVRRFRSVPVPDEHIAQAVCAAQRAATSSWIQAYCLIQVSDPAERRILRELTGDQAQVEQAGAFFAVCADARRLQLIAERAGQPHGVLPLFGLCVGEPADDPGLRPRLPLEAVWMKGRYLEDEPMLELIEAHDREASRHYATRGLSGRTWSAGTWRKFTRRLREHLLEYYRAKGAVFE